MNNDNGDVQDDPAEHSAIPNDGKMCVPRKMCVLRKMCVPPWHLVATCSTATATVFIKLC